MAEAASCWAIRDDMNVSTRKVVRGVGGQPTTTEPQSYKWKWPQEDLGDQLLDLLFEYLNGGGREGGRTERL